MKKCTFILFLLVLGCKNVTAQNNLPAVFTTGSINDMAGTAFKLEAEKAYNTLQVAGDKERWEKQKEELREKIIEKAGVSFFPDLPLDYHETKSHRLEGYTVKNIFFQTRPQVYATANLYIPDGEGPFPAVVVMMGHSRTGKTTDEHQALGHTLALNGYVSINIDPWGAGERTTKHGEFEYHGANLGASLLNVGKHLMGLQITDNMRAVDLLCSFPFVDTLNIGATGASGGGNQTMWLAAIDSRIKAAVPVVSVGTFQSYVLNSNCICETLIDGLTFTEEAAVLGLIAPRALKLCNGLKDTNRAFHPQEMLKSYRQAQPIYRYYGAENNLSYQLFDTPHGYYPEMRETMLGWFDLHLKNIGSGEPKKEKDFTLLPEPDLMVFPEDRRFPGVISTQAFCYNEGMLLKTDRLTAGKIDVEDKTRELKKLLRIKDDNQSKTVRRSTDSGNWERYVIETASKQLIPVLIYAPDRRQREWVIIGCSEGKNKIPYEVIENHVNKNQSVCIVDFWGIGESASAEAKRIDGDLPEFHTLSRSALWLGQTVQGIWVNQLDVVVDWLSDAHDARKITIEADKELAVAALLFSALSQKADNLILKNIPMSYLYDKTGDADYFSMAIHIPGILCWGDISLATALCESEIVFIDPVSITGRTLDKTEIDSFNKEVKYFSAFSGKNATIHFINTN